MTRARVYEGRSHFLALSAKVLRQVLIDHERKRRADKRDAGQEPLRISHHAVAPGTGLDLADLLGRLTELGQRHPRQARVVELRFLSSMTEAEVAEVLGYSERTVRADWRFARAWLAGRLDGRSFE